MIFAIIGVDEVGEIRDRLVLFSLPITVGIWLTNRFDDIYVLFQSLVLT